MIQLRTVRGVWSGRLVQEDRERFGRRCEACGDLLPPQRGPGRPRTTCNRACRQRAYRARKSGGAPRDSGWRRCVWCGKGFPRQHGFGPIPRFCSTECVGLAKAQRRNEVVSSALGRLKRSHDQWDLYIWAVERYKLGTSIPVCPVCGDIFFDEEGRPGRPKVYCSDRCRWHGHELRWRECPVCLEWYDRTDAQGRLTKQYCSDSCQGKARHRRHRGQPVPNWQFRAEREHLPAWRPIRRRRQKKVDPDDPSTWF